MPIFNPVLTGGGGRKPGEPLDPVQVYKDTRPADWLPMPTEAQIQDNEIYMLFHIPDGASSLLAFRVTCTGNYTVALGTMINGAFAQSSSVSIASGETYEAELMADDYGDPTGDGFQQVIIKVSGTDILIWEPSTHTKKTSPAGFTKWNIVEIFCKLPKAEKFTCMDLNHLVYAGVYGETEILYGAHMFAGAESLKALIALNTSKMTYMRGVFGQCYNLISIPRIDISSAENTDGMFRACRSLDTIPELNMSNVIDSGYMFDGCTSLKEIKLDTKKCFRMSKMFQSCTSLKNVHGISLASAQMTDFMFAGCEVLETVNLTDTSELPGMWGMFRDCRSLKVAPQIESTKVTNISQAFGGCTRLKIVPRFTVATGATLHSSVFDQTALESIHIHFVPPVSSEQMLYLVGCCLGHKAIITIFNELPAVEGTNTVTLTGNPGVAELTDGEKAIATEKGWTLTL